MDIRSMFVKSIDRDIKGVIKVGQTDEENVFEELDEYVITKQLARHFRDFFGAYERNLRAPTDKVGVWISGFFGSGKSHFLKILSYILANKPVKGRTAFSFFQDKIEDDLVLGNMEKAAQADSDVILFNIDAKGAHGRGSIKEGIVSVFAKVFYEKQGFYGDMLWVADMEKALTQEGVYEDFKAAIKELSGESWEKRRRRVLFDRDLIVKALQKARGMSEDAALRWFKAKDANVVLSVENFAHMVKEYLDTKGPNHRLIFLADEVGQYIGDNSQMMLELQTIVEELGTICQGRAWVLVTSQEELVDIVKGVGLAQEVDYSKIQGRFDTRLNLTSANVDEVIKRRLLEKNSTATDTLRLYFGEKSAVLRNLITFTGGMPDAASFRSETEFAEVYPFIPYQFNLLQKVFTAIREHASSGRHLASGERSLLSAFQEAAQTYGDEEVGALVPFHEFYESVSSFLDSAVSRVVEQAEDMEGLEPEDIDVLKLLFMIKYVDEMPARLENITTLMINHVDQDKLALEKSIQASLRRLQERTLIQRNGDLYIFLTNEEQEINREIKRMEIEPHRLAQKIGDLIFASDDIYPFTRFRYSSRHNLDFKQMIDDRPRGPQDGELTLQVITPNYNEGFGEQDYRALSARNPNSVILVLPSDNRAFLDELEVALKIEAYLVRGTSMQMSANLRDIIDSKREEQAERDRRAKSLILDALGDAKVYVRGDRLDLRTRNPREKIDQGLRRLVENIYLKLNYVQDFVDSTAELQNILTGGQRQLYAGEKDPNYLALEEVEALVERRHLQDRQLNMKELLDHFKKAPFGWNENDIAALVAKLARAQKIRLQYGGSNLKLGDRNIPDYLTKRNEVEKLVIRKRVGVPQKLITAVKNIAHTVFHHTNLPADEDGLTGQMLNIIRIQKDKAAGLLERYEDRNGDRYPGKEQISEAQRLLESIAVYSEPVQLFEALAANEEKLAAKMKYVALVEEFFGRPRKHFDDALAVLDLYENNKEHLIAADVQEIAAEIRAIVSKEEPYSEISKLPSLRTRFNDRFSILVEKACHPIEERIKRDYAAVREELAKYEFEPDFKREISATFENLLEGIRSANDLNKAYSMEVTSRRRRDEAWDLIEQRLALERKKEAEESDKPPIITPTIRRTRLRFHELFESRVVLKDPQDLDEFIQNLKAKLSKRLQDEDEIEIVW